MGSCKNCKSKSLIEDSATENLVCSSCGVVQDFNNYEQQTFNADGFIGTNVRLGTSGSRYDYSYRETKIYLAQKIVSDVLYKLNLDTRVEEVNNMIKLITEEEYGSGNWFNLLVGACIYVVMRKANKWLPLTSVCNCVGCDTYELGRMVYRVVDHLDLNLPNFDIVGLFDRVFKEWVECRSDIGKDKIVKMVKQGTFLLQCMIKWFVTTGRRPVPVVVGVIVFVCQLNEVEVSIEDLATKLNVAVVTCKLRYNELLKKLVEVARVRLPWGDDVNVKNIMKNAPIVIQYMEVKLMCKPTNEIKTLEDVGVHLDGLVRDCLDKRDEIYSTKDSEYDNSQDSNDWEINDLRKIKVSPECLSMIYLKHLEEYSNIKKTLTEKDNSNELQLKKSDKSGFLLDTTTEYWSGNSALSKKLFLDQILEKDVGMNTMPVSYVNGCLKTERRKEKIKAAKIRIEKIRRPQLVANGSNESNETLVMANSRKRKQKSKKVNIDWEDFVIETLLLHQAYEGRLSLICYADVDDTIYSVSARLPSGVLKNIKGYPLGELNNVDPSSIGEGLFRLLRLLFDAATYFFVRDISAHRLCITP